MNAPLPVAAAGIRYNMPEAEYHALDALGSTDIKRLLRSPAHFRAGRDASSEPTAAQQLGTAIHLAVLEPARFAAETVAAPKFDRRTNAGKAAAAEFEALHAGKALLEPADFDIVRRVADSVHAHPGARELLNGGLSEVSLRWTDPQTGAPCKARIDRYRPDGGIVDLKSAEDASPAGFARAIARYAYAAQAAHYRRGAELVAGPVPFFAFIAVEKDPPYAVGVYVLDDAAIDAAFARVAAAYERYMSCVQAGQWPAYSPLIEPITPPAWAI